jgi:TetR/AcrR family transcriptional repressor of nem operon
MGGRPRAFDEQTVLERAMELFWRDGYAATSLQALLDHMGISRQSLYNAFGDKRKLYLACLDRYIERRASAMLAELEKPDAGYADVLAFFDRLRDVEDEGGEVPRTCLIGRSCVELGADDDVAGRVQAHMERTMRAFANALRNAVERGELEPLDPKAVARHLTATLQGLGIMRRAGATLEELGGAVQVALSVMKPAAAPADLTPDRPAPAAE